MIKKTTYRLEHFKAWCCGKSYPIPNKAIIVDDKKFIRISVDDVILGDFNFYLVEDFRIAKQYLRRKLAQLKKGLDGKADFNQDQQLRNNPGR